MRGEYYSADSPNHSSLELPPRARRIHHGTDVLILPKGTTSACAENTICRCGASGNKRNYLRVRGEYPLPQPQKGKIMELPPRARRILNSPQRRLPVSGTTSACAENTTTRRQPAAIIGTTSACAENTLLSISHQGRAWNYLRVRGEYTRKILTRITSRELPPRARRIRSTGLLDPIDGRTTSACAENTDNKKI